MTSKDIKVGTFKALLDQDGRIVPTVNPEGEQILGVKSTGEPIKTKTGNTAFVHKKADGTVVFSGDYSGMGDQSSNEEFDKMFGGVLKDENLQKELEKTGMSMDLIREMFNATHNGNDLVVTTEDDGHPLVLR